MMRTIFILILFALPIYAFSQKIGNGLLNAYRSVGRVSYISKSGQRSFGTGTLMYRTWPNATMSVYLITCKHLLPVQPVDADIIYFDIANPKSSIGFSTMIISVFDSSGNYDPIVKFDSDGNDLAIIDVTGFFREEYRENMENILQTIVPYELILTKDSISPNSISVGDDIFFVGFPAGLYDRRNMSPILRAGVISTPPQEDFYFNDIIRQRHWDKFKEILPDRLNGFLIDANAIGGSSGSLFFLKPQTIRLKNGQLQFHQGGGDLLILGILAFSYLDLGYTIDPIRINVGGVISAAAIKKTIDLFN